MSNYIKEFGLFMFFNNSFSRILRFFHLDKSVEKYEKKKFKRVVKWLDKRYGSIVDPFDSVPKSNTISNDSTIWIFWWQGEETMPDVVSACYKSVLKHKGNHRVVLVTKDNYKQYIDLPTYIIGKVEKGNITLTHFSDIVRENLLYYHGGIWMDATIYMTSAFPSKLYNYEYYSLKGAFNLFDWSGFFQASSKGNILAKYMTVLFNAYWKDHDYLITYLLIDCFITLVRNRNGYVAEMINNLPVSGKDVFYLNDKLLDKKFNDAEYETLILKTNIHKLSYKFAHASFLEGEQTFWGKIVG